MNAVDVRVVPRDPELVRLEQHIGVRVADRRLEAVRGELDQQPERILEVDRVHEAAVLHPGVADPSFVKTLHRLRERRLGHGERDVMHDARLPRRRLLLGRPLLVREDRDQPAVAGIEVQMALRGVVEVRLLEDERHPERALPEVDGRLPVGAVDRDVVDALCLDLPHRYRSTSRPLYSDRSRLPYGTNSTRVCTTSNARILSRIASARSLSGSAPRASSTATGSGGSCATPGMAGRTRIWPLTRGVNPPMTSRTALGKTFTPRTMSMSSVRPKQRMRGPVRPHEHGPMRTTT